MPMCQFTKWHEVGCLQLTTDYNEYSGGRSRPPHIFMPIHRLHTPACNMRMCAL